MPTPILTLVFKALANPKRRRIYQIICRHEGRRGRGMPLERVRRLAGMKQPAVSHHVARLAAAGLVLRRRDGRRVSCAPCPQARRILLRFARNPASFPPEDRGTRDP